MIAKPRETEEKAGGQGSSSGMSLSACSPGPRLSDRNGPRGNCVEGAMIRAMSEVSFQGDKLIVLIL